MITITIDIARKPIIKIEGEEDQIVKLLKLCKFSIVDSESKTKKELQSAVTELQKWRSNDVLSEELVIYAEAKERLLLKSKNQWVLIKGDKISVWESYEKALEMGYQTFGLTPFLVKQILENEPIVNHVN